MGMFMCSEYVIMGIKGFILREKISLQRAHTVPILAYLLVWKIIDEAFVFFRPVFVHCIPIPSTHLAECTLRTAEWIFFLDNRVRDVVV